MTEPHDAPAGTSESGTAIVPPEVAAPPVPGSRYRTVAVVLAGTLLLVNLAGMIALFWLFGQPWTPPTPPPDPRIDVIAAALQQSRQQEAAATATLQALDRRVAALEANPAAADDVADLRQQLVRLAAAAAALSARLDAAEKAVRSQTAGDPTDIALVLALLQIRDAVEAGRPFAAGYEALAALARTRPEIAAAAAPLAEPATTGLVGRPVLADRLRELAGAIGAANTPASATADTPENTRGAVPDWADQAWSRLSGLVTIRRIDGAGQGPQGAGPAAAVNAALRTLAGGDLQGAVVAIEALTGAPAEAAGPWLRMAKERLAAEAALQRVERLLVARLGAPANAPAGAGPPR